MINRILVPLDGSELAETALPYAKQLALGLNAEVRVLRVLDASRAAGLLPGIAKPADEKTAARAAEEYLARIKAYFSGLRSNVVTEHTSGVPEVEIIAEADDKPGTLTVMSTHGRSGAMRWLVGSVAAKVVQFGSGPVLLVRPAARSPLAGDPAFRHMLIALDGSARAEQVFLEAGPLATALELDVFLIRATPGLAEYARWSSGEVVMPDYATLMEDVDRDAEQYLNKIAADFKSRYQVAVRTLRVHGDAAQAILDAAQAEGTLVAMTTHGRTGFARALLGSVADRVVRHGTTPVLLVRSAPTA